MNLLKCDDDDVAVAVAEEWGGCGGVVRSRVIVGCEGAVKEEFGK